MKYYIPSVYYCCAPLTILASNQGSILSCFFVLFFFLLHTTGLQELFRLTVFNSSFLHTAHSLQSVCAVHHPRVLPGPCKTYAPTHNLMINHPTKQPNTPTGGGDDGKKKRRKKSNGSSKDGRDSSRSTGGGGGGGLRIIDDEADMMTLDTKKVNKAWEEEETEGVACVFCGLRACVAGGLALGSACSLPHRTAGCGWGSRFGFGRELRFAPLERSLCYPTRSSSTVRFEALLD